MNSNRRYEIRLSGSGGQGLIMAGIILAEASSLYGGYNAIQSQSYGPEARGGASKAEVIISPDEIFFPKAQKLDLLLSLSQDACDKYYHDLKGDGILVVDTTYVKAVPHHERVYAHPFTRIAIEKMGKAIVTNILCLGALAGIVKYVKLEHLKKTLKDRLPEHLLELNLKALDEGHGLIG
ncbi:MAG: 2-oxoacid:acceptor oxidoreductase family protein [Candidatus Wallbacteria bacterium]|nr:2-oxoacid:acceptor oxidoreductase family protein [Candidatus Wallbacteria bacterium]